MPTSEIQRVYDQMTRFLHDGYRMVLRNAPTPSMTPLEYVIPPGNDELMFVIKAELELYSEFTDLLQGAIQVTMYTEGDKLIFRLDIRGCYFESEIQPDKIKQFLAVLHKQEYVTVMAVDHLTLRVVWLTNNLNLRANRNDFSPIFKRFGFPI